MFNAKFNFPPYLKVRRYFAGLVAGCSANEVSEGGGEDGGVAPLPFICPDGGSGQGLTIVRLFSSTRPRL